MKKWLIALVIAIVLITGIFLVKTNYISGSSNSPSVDTGSGSGTVLANSSDHDVGPADQKWVSRQELSMHDTQADCWVAYDGKVYDITSWLPIHPGSAAAIAPYCGTSEEFTNAFTAKHGTSKVSKLMDVGTFMGDFEIVGKA